MCTVIILQQLFAWIDGFWFNTVAVVRYLTSGSPAFAHYAYLSDWIPTTGNLFSVSCVHNNDFMYRFKRISTSLFSCCEISYINPLKREHQITFARTMYTGLANSHAKHFRCEMNSHDMKLKENQLNFDWQTLVDPWMRYFLYSMTMRGGCAPSCCRLHPHGTRTDAIDW